MFLLIPLPDVDFKPLPDVDFKVRSTD